MAARFPDRERATVALDRLHRQLNNGLQAEIAPLASEREPASAVEPASETVLAGHFPDEQTPAVADIVTASGGEIVTDVDEAWTRPRFSPQDGSHDSSRDDNDGARGYSC